LSGAEEDEVGASSEEKDLDLERPPPNPERMNGKSTSSYSRSFGG